MSSTSDPSLPRAHSCQFGTPRFSALRRSARACGSVRRRQLFEGDAFAEQLVDERELLAIGHRIERKRGRAGVWVELVESEVKALAGAPHDDAFRGVGVARGELRVGRCPLLAEPDVVGVRVEDDEAKVGLHEQPFQHQPERVRLPGARLAAQERVPVEAAGVERRRHAGLEQELADRQRRSRRPNRRQPLGHLGGLGGTRERIVERLAVAVEDDALAADRAQHHPSSQLQRPVAARDLGAIDSSQLERHDLAEPASVIGLEHDVPADLELEPVQRGLQLEAPAVDRRRKRKDRLLDLPSQLTELGRLLIER